MKLPLSKILKFLKFPSRNTSKKASLVVDRYSFRFLFDSFRSAPKIFERMSSRVVWS